MATQAEERPPNRDMEQASARELFSQSCQMFRQFMTARYYIFTVGGVSSAALVTLFYTDNAIRTVGQQSIIRACGVTVLVIMCIYDLGTACELHRYHKLMNYYAERLNDTQFPKRFCCNDVVLRFLYGPTAMLAVFAIIGIIAWLLFAKAPGVE